MEETLIIFIRRPELGKVKTRLARTLGEEEALRIYLLLCDKTRAAAEDVEVKRLLFYTDGPIPVDDWSETRFDKRIQFPGDLGARMSAAFNTAFEEGARRAVIIGSDCPELNGALLRQAFEDLKKQDAVIGPVADGGYYLLGLRRPCPELFQDMPWSTESVRVETEKRLRAAGLNYTLLPRLSDIDTADDWSEYLKRS